MGEAKYSVEVEYGEDSSLIRRDKTSQLDKSTRKETLQLDKSNKFRGCDKWKIPEGGQVRLLKDCSSLYRHHYGVNTETKVSPEDVEKIKESWRKANSFNICHEIKTIEEPMEEMFVKKNVIGFSNRNLFQLRPGTNSVRFISQLWSYECSLRNDEVLVSQAPEENNLKRYKALVIDRRDGCVKILDIGTEIAYSIFKLENDERWGSCKCYDLDIVVEGMVCI